MEITRYADELENFVLHQLCITVFLVTNFDIGESYKLFTLNTTFDAVYSCGTQTILFSEVFDDLRGNFVTVMLQLLYQLRGTLVTFKESGQNGYQEMIRMTS